MTITPKRVIVFLIVMLLVSFVHAAIEELVFGVVWTEIIPQRGKRFFFIGVSRLFELITAGLVFWLWGWLNVSS